MGLILRLVVEIVIVIKVALDVIGEINRKH